MPKLTTIALATALLGASTIAFADPTPQPPPPPPGDGSITVRDHRHGGGSWNNSNSDGSSSYDDSSSYDGSYNYDDSSNYDDSYDGATDESWGNRGNGNYDNYGNGQQQRPVAKPRWVELGTAGSGKTGIGVGADMGRFQSLRLTADGWMRIKQVVVVFSDGTTQKVRMMGSMSGRSAPLVIDLGGTKQIERMFVYAGQFGRGTVHISGLTARKVFWRPRRDQLDSYQR